MGGPTAQPRARVRLDVLEWDAADLVIGVSADQLPDHLDDPHSVAVEVLLRDRAGEQERVLPAQPARLERLPARGDRPRLVVRAEARLSTVSGGLAAQLGPGLWDVFVRLTVAGTTGEQASYDVRLGGERGPDLPATPPRASFVGRATRTMRPYWTDKGNLSLAFDRQPPGRGLRASAVEVQRRATQAQLRMVLPLRGPEPVESQVLVRLAQDGREAVELPARLHHTARARTSEVEVVVPLNGRGLGSGTWTLHLLLGDSAAATGVDLELRGVGPAALVRAQAAGAEPPEGNPLTRAAEAVAGFVGSVRRVARSL